RHEIGKFKWLPAWQNTSQGCLPCCSRIDQQIFISEQPIGLDCRKGVLADYRKQLFHNPELDEKLHSGPRWNTEVCNFAGIQSGHPHLISNFEPAHSGKFCIIIAASGEQHSAVSN